MSGYGRGDCPHGHKADVHTEPPFPAGEGMAWTVWMAPAACPLCPPGAVLERFRPTPPAMVAIPCFLPGSHEARREDDIRRAMAAAKAKFEEVTGSKPTASEVAAGERAAAVLAEDRALHALMAERLDKALAQVDAEAFRRPVSLFPEPKPSPRYA